MDHLRMRILFRALVVSGLVFGTGTAYGQGFPTKVIRVITGTVGGGLDLGARMIAQGLSKNLPQQAIVDNRGGVPSIPALAVIKAEPDGHTILYFGNSVWLLPLLQPSVPYDPRVDFAPITLAVSSPNVLVVNPTLPATSVKELIALAKAKPGELNYASGISGSSNHLAAELFKSMAGVNIVRIAYKGKAAGLADLVSGRVQVMFPSLDGMGPIVKSGKLRALAVTGRTPSKLFPGVPTVDESALPGYESQVSYAALAPAKTPASVVAILHREIVRTLNSTEVRERFEKSEVEVIASTPGQLASTIKSEMTRMEKVIIDSGMRNRK